MNGAVANVLNSVLGTWVDNINSDQLKLSIFAGEVTLKDLKLKDSAIESLGFPFTLQYGRIASLKVDIPWSKLSSSPLVIEISEIYGLISPSPPSSWSESKEKEKMKVFKKALIENYEALSSSELSISEEKGFVEKLVKKIILNVQIRIKGVYLIFQDPKNCYKIENLRIIFKRSRSSYFTLITLLISLSLSNLSSSSLDSLAFSM